MNYFTDMTGDENYYDHEECGDIKHRLYVRFVGNGWLYCCHNGGCNFRGFKKASLAEQGRNYIEQSKKETTPTTGENVEEFHLPHDFTKAIPTRGLDWLKGYGITEVEIDVYNLGWSDYYERLIFPIYNQDTLVGWQGRQFGPPPKYLTRKSNNVSNIYFEIKRSPEVVVVVEDIVSAIKVGRVSSSLAILGSPAQIPQLIFKHLLKYPKVLVWFDRDKLKESIGWSQTLKLYGIDSRAIWTDRDPKCYPERYIAQEVFQNA